MVDKAKRMVDTEERKGKVTEFGNRAPGSKPHQKKGKKAEALDTAPESNPRGDEDELSDVLEAGWRALTLAERSEVIMEDFADYRADGGVLASARYYLGIRQEFSKFHASNENFEAGIPNPFEDPQHDIFDDEENCCIETALDARCNERPASHVEHCECELCVEYNAAQPLDALTRKEKDIFYKLEDIMCRLAEESDHPALTDYVFDTFGKYYGAMYNVSGETMDLLHVAYHDGCECQVCNNYATTPRARIVSVKTPVVTNPETRTQTASVGTVGDFEHHPGWI
ncbi:hypothetical protein N431DRAFT_511198 [Stipitochalara longipes BDJ]|nr:hypothetical protein N431DRAFT_511198 [Stipitochalara longipes BDJ]